MSDLQKTFKETISKRLKNELQIHNVHAVPRLLKIVVNIGVKNVLLDKKKLQVAQGSLAQITGQKPKVTKARKAIASFKLRQGDEIGLMVTLRGKRMYDFFEKLTSIVLPRLRDFHGVRRTQFDGKGNYTLGLSEYAVFPEIDQGNVENVQGLEVSIVTTAKDNKEGTALLEALGMPFMKGK